VHTIARRDWLLTLASLALGACSSGNAEKSSGGGASGGAGTAGGGGTSGSGGASGSGASGASGADSGVASAYPSGPYGNNLGDTMPNLSWQGYVNDAADALSTTKPFGPYSMDDLRKSGRPLALMHLSEYF
jgi:hypothetical protein